MKLESNPKYQIINNETLSRFEIEINGEFAYVEHRRYKDNIVLMHTFVPESARGKGIASALAKYALEWVKKEKKKLMIYCPAIAKYMKMHPEYDYLRNKEFLG